MADGDLKVVMALAHLVSLKELVAAGLRSPALLMASLEKSPKEQREAVETADRIVRGLLTNGGGGAGSVASTPTQQRSGGPPPDVAAGLVTSPTSGSLALQPQPPTSSRSPAQPSSPSELSPRAEATVCSTSPKASRGIISTSSTTSVLFASTSRSPSLRDQFVAALLGQRDAPQPIGCERPPRPPTTGLLHGDDRPMKLLLHSNRQLLDGLLALLEGELHESLSLVNMLWCQHHPVDFEAAAIDSSRQRLAAATSRGGSSNNSGDRAAAAAASHSSSSPASIFGTNTRRGSSDGSDALEHQMRYLLFLNLHLKYPPQQWSPLLQLRDETVAVLKQVRASIDRVVSSSNISVPSFPSVVRLYAALDKVLSAMQLMNIFATPDDIFQTFFHHFSNALMELQVVLHDHPDLCRNKKLCKAVEETASDGIRALKNAVGWLQSFATNPVGEVATKDEHNGSVDAAA